MTDETTTEQLAEIEAQAMEFTPPDGWRPVPLGETLRGGDEYHQGLNRYIRRIEPEPQPQAEPVQVREGRWKTRNGKVRNVTPTPTGHVLVDDFPWWDGIRSWRNDGRYAVHENAMDLLQYLGAIEPVKTQELPADYTPPEGWRLVEVGEDVDIPGRDQYVIGPNRYIRPIEPEPQPEPQPEPRPELWPQPEPVQVCEGRWKTRGGDIRNVTPTPEGDGRKERWPWRDAAYDQTWTPDGRYYSDGDSALDLVTYLGPIEQQPQPEPADTADELRSEVSHVQNLLGSEKRRVVELETLVRDLRTMIEGSEKAVDAAGKQNTALRRQLAVVEKELTTAAAVSLQLQIELDAAQQVPADSPQLRQLRSDLAEVAHDRDQYKDTYDRIVADLETMRETTKAETVEAIIEWLEPFRGCNSPSLALLLLEALPHIMRSLTGLADEDVE